ncbi:MAG: hypothetical protein HDT15_04120 [Oscillibacter sp.]|nr:hypothetical protein [Oscillibacter sp.]
MRYTPYRGQRAGSGARNSLLILLLGVVLGALGKWSDGYVAWLAELTSGISLWILLATAVALYSRTAMRAALNVFLLLGGMVGAYYLTAVLTNSVWGKNYLIGWGVAAVLSAIPGYLVWFAKGRSRRAWLLSLGVVVVQITLVIVLFRTVRIFDVVTILLTAAVLLVDKIVPSRGGR